MTKPFVCQNGSFGFASEGNAGVRRRDGRVIDFLSFNPGPEKEPRKQPAHTQHFIVTDATGYCRETHITDINYGPNCPQSILIKGIEPLRDS